MYVLYVCFYINNTGGYIYNYNKINSLLKLHIDVHIKMSMCMHAGIHSSLLDYPLQMNQAAHCQLPRRQTWTDVHSMYTQHYIITLLLLL